MEQLLLRGPTTKGPWSPSWERKGGGKIMTELKEIGSGLIWEERFTASFRLMESQTKTTGSENPKALEP